MIHVLRAGERFHSVYDGIATWHCFSAGAHYDPGNVAFGPLVGCDEHVVGPGRGFDWHAHRGVDIVSWVVSGRLRHEDAEGRSLELTPGAVLVQRTAGGVRHRETNPSADQPLRLVQLTLVGSSDGPGVTVAGPPVTVGASRFRAVAADTGVGGPWHLFVTAGRWRVDGTELDPGDSARGGCAADIRGAGSLLVVELGAAPEGGPPTPVR